MTLQDQRADGVQQRERLAAIMDWPSEPMAELLGELAHALRYLRANRAERPEQVLAAQWRSTVPSGGDLDDLAGYLRLGQAVQFFLRVTLSGEHSAACAKMVNELAEKGWISALGVGRHDADAPAERLQQLFTELGTPLQPVDMTAPVGETTAVFAAMGLIKAMHVHMGSPILTDEVTVDLVLLSMAAHALNAPDDVWPLVSPGEPARAVEQPVDDFDGDSHTLAAAIIEANIKCHDRLTAAIEHRTSMKAATDEVELDIDRLRLSTNTRTQLRAIGLDLSVMDELAAHQAEYQRKGAMGKLAMGSRRGDLRWECEDLFARWHNAVRMADEAVSAAQRSLRTKLDAFAPAVARLQPGPESALADFVRPQGDYVGRSLAEDPALRERVRVFPRRLWQYDLLRDQPWATLPRFDLCESGIVLISDETEFSYTDACRALQGIVLDQMSRSAPRRLRLTWIDPAGRGQSAGSLLELLEIDKDLIDQKVWSEPDDIEAALRRVTDRMAELEQRCLRDTFEHLDAYNVQADLLAEAHHVVVVTGYPRGFTESSAQRLRHISENGARLGVSVLVATTPALAATFRAQEAAHQYVKLAAGYGTTGMPSWWSVELLPQGWWLFGHKGRPHAPVPFESDRDTVYMVYTPCTLPASDPTLSVAIVRGYGTASVEAANVVIASEHLVAQERGLGTTANSINIPIGVRGRGTPMELVLGRGLAQNVLVGGRPGSGKSALFHTMITNAVRRYGPDELEMYLLDFKQGVEFQPYAVGALPHAMVVAVESERDFGLSVLRDLRTEIDKRAEFLRGPDGLGADSVTEYRERGGPLIMPRILLLVDEFQVLFADDDRVAHECAQLLDHIVRQGRAFAVHTVLGTQSLRGHGAMSMLRGTLDLIAVRIVLPTSETDSRLFLADDNSAGSRLTRPGEAIFNGDGGSPPGNVTFQVALTGDDVRNLTVADARRVADETGFERRPRVFDGTRDVTVAEDGEIETLLRGRRPGRPRARFHIGLPVAVGGSGGIDLTRRGGRHVAIVHRDPAIAAGTAVVGIATALASSPTQPVVTVVDCLGVDEENAEVLEEALADVQGVRLLRGRRLRYVLADAAKEVQRRNDEDDHNARMQLLVINALHRARELTDERTYDGSGSPQEDLQSILRDGSHVGVHVVVVADTVDTLERRVGHAGVVEFGARLIGQCSPDASQRLVGSAAASRLGPRYALLHEADEDRFETVRPFPVPNHGWLASAAQREG